MSISSIIDKLAALHSLEQGANREYLKRSREFKEPFIVEKLEWLADEEMRHVQMVSEMRVVFEQRKLR